MKIAIMQPYSFPYIGYFQLINAVDTFVFYDDVNFIKGGWIHRNKILVNNSEYIFSIPLVKQSSFNKINNTYINKTEYNNWLKKYFKTIEQSYKNAPYYDDFFPVIKKVFLTDYNLISELAIHSIKSILNYLFINKELIVSSEEFDSMESLERTKRLIEMANSLKCNEYINAIGGRKLYSKKDFLKKSIDLKFIKSKATVYKQFSNDFVSNLSIIDVLMFNSKEEVLKILDNYEII